jgi:hypothetical protein
MAKRGWVFLGAAMFLSGVGCANVVGIENLPPESDGSGSTSVGRSSSRTSSSSNATSSSGSSGTVVVNGSCTTDADCSQTDCAASCVDWGDGAGGVCSCSCSWGTDCVSGCCWSVDSGAFYACRAADACEPINFACTANYQCLNDNCGSFKTYCFGSACACGCNFNTDCASGCCTVSSSPSFTANVCNDLQTNCMSR